MPLVWAAVVSLSLGGSLPVLLGAGLASGHPEVTEASLRLVEYLGAEGRADNQYIAPLCRLVFHPDDKIRSLAMLALTRHLPAASEEQVDPVVRALVARMQDSAPVLARYATLGLARLGRRCLPTLEEMLTERNRAHLRLLAIQAVGVLLVSNEPECHRAALRLLVALWADRDQEVRSQALKIYHDAPNWAKLTQLRDPALVRTALVRSYPDALVTALLFFERTKEPVAEIIFELLTHPDHTVRCNAAREVWRTGPHPSAVHPLLALQEDAKTDATMRRTIANAFTTICERGDPPPKVVEALLKMLTDPDEENRTRHGPEFIRRTGGRLIPRMIELLDSENALLREGAMSVLFLHHWQGGQKFPDLLPKFTNILKDGNNIVSRRQVAHILGSYAYHFPGLKLPDNATPALVGAMDVRDEELRKACIYALAALAANDLSPILNLLKSKDPELQVWGAKAVPMATRMHRGLFRDTIAPLRKLLESPDDAVRKAAKDALDELRILVP